MNQMSLENKILELEERVTTTDVPEEETVCPTLKGFSGREAL